MLTRPAGRGSPPKTEPLAPDPKAPGSLGPGPAVLGSGATRSRRPQARARGSRNRPGFFHPRAPARGSRPVLVPEPRTAGPGLGPRIRLPKKTGPAPVFREGYRNLPLGPGRRGADLKSAILGSPNADGGRRGQGFGGKNNTNSVDGDMAHRANANCQLRIAGRGGRRGRKRNASYPQIKRAYFPEKNAANSVDGDVAHHANANCRLRTAGWGGGKSPKAKRCLSPEKTRLLSR